MKPILRTISLLGLAAVFGLRVYQSFPLPDRAWTAFALLGLMVVAGGLFFLALRREARLFAAGADLLVPFGLLTAVLAGIGWGSGRPGMEWFSRVFLEFDVGLIHIAVHPALLVLIVLYTLYLSWVSLLVWRAVRCGDVSAAATFGEGVLRWPAAFAAGAFGTAGFLLLLAPVLSGVQDLVAGGGSLAVLLLFPFGLAVNLLTAALVLTVLAGRERFPGAFVMGLCEGFRRPMRWLLPVTALLILLGGLWFVPHAYTETVTTVTSGSGGTTTTTTTNREEGASYGSHVAWIGGYENDTEWDDQVAKEWGTTKVPAVEFLLDLLFAALAILVKLRIARKLEPAA